MAVRAKSTRTPPRVSSPISSPSPTAYRWKLMRRTDVTAPDAAQHLGLAHFAFGCESRAEVDRLTERLRADGHPVLSEPRTTGDGYYESAVGDPDGNLVELVYKA